MGKRDYTVPAIEKALDVLFFLKDHDHQQSTLTEIASGLGLNKSSCFAILRTLQARNLVAFDEDTKKYSLGLAHLELASAVSAQVNHIAIAKPFIERLAQETHITCFLAQRISANTVMVVEKAEFREMIHVSFPIGRRMPITGGATGKVFLAFMSEAEREALLADMGLVQYTPNTIVDWDRFAGELAVIQTRGYAINLEEYTSGLNGLAAPVFDEHGKILMTISAVSFSSVLNTENIHSIGEQIWSAARKVTRTLGGKFPLTLRATEEAEPARTAPVTL
ncbi:MAG TPA: hypothetical protein DEP84_18435 [Chloroflexi bacterium]|nr:hypothetical protein [Chloroflexota bacterium]